MLDIKCYEAGFCRHPESVVTNKFSFKIRQFPMICSLIKHPTQGLILFDTGYSENFFKATHAFPYVLYRHITPVCLTRSLKDQLKEDGIEACDIKYIILSHFHADHISAVDDFPDAQLIASREGYELAARASGIKGLMKGILPFLMEKISNRTWIWIEDLIKTSASQIDREESFDLWGDQSMILCSFPGHAVGHYGLFCQDTRQGPICWVGDAVWTQETLQGWHDPHWITRFLNHDHKAYGKTLHRLRGWSCQNPQVKIIPSHCQKTWIEMSHEQNKNF